MTLPENLQVHVGRWPSKPQTIEEATAHEERNPLYKHVIDPSKNVAPTLEQAAM